MLAALIMILGSLPLAAQKSGAETQRDIDYARGLATRWGFTDMSETVLTRLEKSGASGRVADEIQLLKCDIYAIGAGRVSDRAQRDELLRKALTAYETYISTHSGAENKAQAEASYVDTALNYGRSLSAGLDESAGAEQEVIKKELQESLTKAIAKTGELGNALKIIDNRSAEQDRQLFELLINRASLLLLVARSQTDGVYNFQQAKSSYEQVVDISGETSSAGLRAFIGVGDVYLAEGKPLEAVEFYLFVGDTAIPRDAVAWATQAKELPSDEIQRRFALVQLATPGIIQSLLSSGDAGRACGEGMRLLNIWNRDGLDLISPWGYQSLLGIVTALSEAGGFVGGELKSGTVQWFPSAEGLQAKFPQKRQQRAALDLALALAQQVNEDNRGNSLGARAARLIGEIIEQPGVDVSPEILIEAARGKANDRDHLGAISAYKRVLTAIENRDAAVRAEYGPRVLNGIGRAYMSLERPLEAALVFQESVESWLGDPEFDALNSRGFYNAANALKRKIKGDALIDGLFTSAEQALLKNDTTGQGEIKFRLASRAYDEGSDYPKSRELFKQVPNDAISYEKAMVYVGVCEFQIGREADNYDPAIKVFDDYLNKFVADPLNALGAAQLAKDAKRTEATATAIFYWGLAEFLKAETKKGGDWSKVVQLLEGYEERFPLQTSFAASAMYRVVMAQHQLGNSKAVDATYAKMLAKFPTDRWTARAALEIFSALEADYNRLKTATTPAELAKAKAALRKMADYLEIGNLNAAAPAFSNLRRESQLWMDLGEWAKAESLLRKIVSKFSSGESADQIAPYIVPDLGLALFRQDKLKECADLLAPLVDEKKATLETTATYARALTGYAELTRDEDGRQRGVRVVAGVGTPESLKTGTELLGKLLETVKNREGAWSPVWLGMKFDQVYALHAWSKLDSNRLDLAKSQVTMLQVEYGGDNLPNLQDADLRAKFAWLFGQLR